MEAGLVGGRTLASVIAVATAMFVLPSSASAATTFGSNLSAVADEAFGGAGASTVAHGALPAGSTAGTVTAPIDGVIVRWRVKVGASDTGSVALRVTRPGDSDMRTGAGTSAFVTPGLGAISTFETRMPVQAGDALGLNHADSVLIRALSATGGATSYFWAPALADGGPAIPGTPIPSGAPRQRRRRARWRRGRIRRRVAGQLPGGRQPGPAGR
jgi:hypothetical protein